MASSAAVSKPNTQPIPSMIDFAISREENSIKIFDAALSKGVPEVSPSRLIFSTLGYASLMFLIKITQVAFCVFYAIKRTCEGKYRAAAFYLLATVTLAPLSIITDVISEIIRIASSILACFSSSLSISGWRLAAQIDCWTQEIEKCAFDAICQGSEPTTRSEGELTPFAAIAYFGKETCLGIYQLGLNPHRSDYPLREEVKQFAKLLLEKDPERWEPHITENNLLFPMETSARDLYHLITQHLFCIDQAGKEVPSMLSDFDTASFDPNIQYGLMNPNNPLRLEVIRESMQKIERRMIDYFGYGTFAYSVY